MRGLPVEELLRRPVLAHGIRLGRTVDVIFDPEATRIVGFDVLCGDELHRFLPFPATAIGHDGLEVESTLTLLDTEELAFYREHGRSLATDRELRETLVGVDGAVETADPAGDGAARC
jgi:hypothetical protein